jgi:hypothetical protein
MARASSPGEGLGVACTATTVRPLGTRARNLQRAESRKKDLLTIETHIHRLKSRGSCRASPSPEFPRPRARPPSSTSIIPAQADFRMPLEPHRCRHAGAFRSLTSWPPQARHFSKDFSLFLRRKAARPNCPAPITRTEARPATCAPVSACVHAGAAWARGKASRSCTAGGTCERR